MPIHSNGVWIWQRKTLSQLKAALSVVPRKARMQIVTEYKRLIPCADCNYNWDAILMSFDHRDRTTKRMNISNAITDLGIKALLAEIDKCDLVCMNCHRYREYIRDSTFHAKTNQTGVATPQYIRERLSRNPRIKIIENKKD